MARGRLRIYLGAAPGVGKTVRMLQEGQRRASRGTDVVVGIVETHGRAYTSTQIERLEVLPRRVVEHNGARLEEMDVAAVLARHPDVVLVDELAHHIPGNGAHTRRWEDIDQLLDAGIDVISTVNVQHLESLNDVVHDITGIRQTETVPDAIVRAADQIELVDMTPEALRRRLAHGNVYPADRVDAALANYFRPGNLSALRELALLWVADRVDEALTLYRSDHDINRTWATRERVVVALTGGSEQETLLRRGARIAGRGAGGRLYAVHVVPDDGLRDADITGSAQARIRQLTNELGGEMHVVTGSDVGGAILDFARSVNATQIVVGASRRSRWKRLAERGVGDSVVAGCGDIDVLMVTHEGAHETPDRSAHPDRALTPLGRERVGAAWLLATVGTVLLTAVLHLLPGGASLLPLELLSYLALTVLTAIVGGLWPAVAAAVLSSVLTNWFFTPPLDTLTIDEPENVAALVGFVVIAVAVALLVHFAARRAAEAGEARRRSDILAALAHSLLATEDQLPALLRSAHDLFGGRGAAIVERNAAGRVGSSVARVGDPRTDELDAPVTSVRVDDEHVLVIDADVAPAGDRPLVEAFADHAAAILRRTELAEQAERAEALARDNRERGALLAAVSHDLRTPLAGIKAGVSSLRSTSIALSDEDRAELLAVVESSTDQLDGLIENLLDMSRIQSRTITARTDDVLVTDIVRAALATVSDPDRVRLRPERPGLAVRADPGLGERVVANIVENALRYSGGRQEVVVGTARVKDAVEIRVVDRGPGVPATERAGIFAPFQRYGDSPRGDGVGLGLAVARGLTEAMHGTIEAEDTPGGGLTMIVSLPVAKEEA